MLLYFKHMTYDSSNNESHWMGIFLLTKVGTKSRTRNIQTNSFEIELQVDLGKQTAWNQNQYQNYTNEQLGTRTKNRITQTDDLALVTFVSLGRGFSNVSLDD